MRLLEPTRIIGAFLFLGACVITDAAPVKPGEKPKYTNRLVDEKSPYLLQHAHNPVDWYPWGEEAFAAAKEQDKPIFLSIGYSTCHWCHVMERETFADEKTAEYLNEHFINIKIDREERPDVDKIYMSAVQAISEGRGGWPLNAFLTPDRKPFFGGTYFQKEQFNGLARNINKAWKEDRANIDKSADGLTDFLKKRAEEDEAAAGGDGAKFDNAMLEAALGAFKQDFDKEHGGWGKAPKFPSPSQPRFMLLAGKRFGDQEAIDQVLLTCDKMAAGGIYDQLGGGFCRYSVDAEWIVPHFEKMLYDNAQLIQLYLDAYLVSGEKRYADVVHDVLRYVLRDMTHPDGGFFSAEDADSEGKEGKFYCWTKAQLAELLSAEESAAVVKHFGVTDSGNFVDHSDPDHLKDQNVFFLTGAEMDKGELAALDSARGKLFSAREKRVRPGLDDKVLTSWNGLMLGAIARAGRVLNEPKYVTAANRNLSFLQAKLWDEKEGRLYHRWREGERDSMQLLETHAFLLEGVIDLYEVTLDPAHLEFAIKVAKRMIEAFYDEKGGFFQSTGTDDLILRVKDYYDGAQPSGNSVASRALLRLSKITDDKQFSAPAEQTLKHFAGKIREIPQAVPYLLTAVDLSLNEPKRVVLVGDVELEATQKMLATVHGVYQPSKVVLGVEGPVEEFARKELKPNAEKGKVIVFVCQGTFCDLPTSDPLKVTASLLQKDQAPK
ncbi:MAG: thioredoxin domain-containing protein [Verrucomicrobiales bacterium]